MTSTTNEKPREFFLYLEAGAPDVIASKPIYGAGEIHVIEKKYYDKAVAALKNIYADGSYKDIASDFAEKALRELGEV